MGEGSRPATATCTTTTTGASVQDWNQMECRLQYLQAELDEAFHRLADERWREVEAGATVEWDDARAWVEARLRGETPGRPR